MRRFSLLFIAFLLNAGVHYCFGQKLTHSRLKKDSLFLVAAQKSINEQCKEDIAGLSGPHKKYFKEIYQERADYLNKLFENDAIVSDPEAVAYLNSIVQVIINGNPSLKSKKPRVLLFKAWWPNASSMGEGTILCNIGLLYKVKNEAQLAFVLCHELAHLYLDHGNQAIAKYVNTVYDEEFQKELKKISKQAYEKNRRLNELEKTIEFSSRRHSRSKETEADSMAIELLSNTGYSLEEGRATLAMLDSIDEDKYNIEPPLKKYFDHSSYTFREAWLKEEESFFGGATMKVTDKKLADSLKTHPDCKKRAAMVAPIIGRKNNQNRVASINEQELLRWQKEYDFEIIAYTFDRDFISNSLYYSLQTLEQYPGDNWLISMIGQSMNRLYEAQKKHELSKIIDLPSPYQEKKYNDFLNFLQRLSLTDIAMINYYFLDSHKDKLLSSEDFVYALIRSKEFAGKPDEKRQWIQFYQNNFSNPRYKFSP